MENQCGFAVLRLLQRSVFCMFVYNIVPEFVVYTIPVFTVLHNIRVVRLFDRCPCLLDQAALSLMVLATSFP